VIAGLAGLQSWAGWLSSWTGRRAMATLFASTRPLPLQAAGYLPSRHAPNRLTPTDARFECFPGASARGIFQKAQYFRRFLMLGCIKSPLLYRLSYASNSCSTSRILGIPGPWPAVQSILLTGPHADHLTFLSAAGLACQTRVAQRWFIAHSINTRMASSHSGKRSLAADTCTPSTTNPHFWSTRSEAPLLVAT
jgi:hypothetical protein